MAKDKAKAKKKHWWSYLGDAYKITKRSFTWLPWGLLGAVALGLVIGLILGFITKSWILWSITGVMLAFVFPLLLLTRLVRKASYLQLDGMPGAASAILENLGRGWDVKTEPVRFNARTQDMLFRAISRRGVVLVTEGPVSRVRNLIDDERRAIKRVAPNAPVNVVMVGHEKGQVPLEKVEATIRKFPKSISNQEVAALGRRFEAINPNNMPMPKGIDPYKTRMNRKALRGK